MIVPAYNEDDRLGIMVDEAMAYLTASSASTEKKAQKGKGRISGGAEILVVDDGSTDGTTKTAQALSKKWNEENGVEIRVVTLTRNRGKGGAVQHVSPLDCPYQDRRMSCCAFGVTRAAVSADTFQGVCHARGRLILFADADGATRFSDLNDLLAAMDKISDQDGHGIVVGSRAHLVKSEAVVKVSIMPLQIWTHAESMDSQRSKMRNALMHGFHLFLRTIGVGGIRDTQCGFKVSYTFPPDLVRRRAAPITDGKHH